jgi:chloramphenicol-sensitive protein RarD
VSPRNRCLAYASLSYILWGLFPVYFKLLQSVPAIQVVAHRVVWSLAFLLLVLAIRHRWGWIVPAIRQPRVVVGFIASALALSANWILFVWGVSVGRIVDVSLGYFINPLVNVLIGAVFLHERLHDRQWIAVGLAVAGVGWLTWQFGEVPWLGLALAASFGSYGLLRKTARLGALEGLTLETTVLLPFAIAFLGYVTRSGDGLFLPTSDITAWLLVASGPVTALPLLLFAAGARGISFSTLGILQYFAPSLQLLIGVVLYAEPFGYTRAVGFGLIWLGLAIYTIEGMYRSLRTDAQRV